MLSFKNISLSFDGNQLITDLSFDVNDGDKFVFRGKSGSGKTTLINVITAFVRPVSGTITFNGRPLQKDNIRDLRQSLAYLPQQINFNNYGVRQFLELPFEFARNKSLTPDREKILSYFSAFDLKPGLLNARMQDISGGEKQRLALVSCLLLERKILLLDEPTASLDKQARNLVMDYLFANKNLTIVSASHDHDWVMRCNKIIDLKN